jgi:hypothetical protein
MSTSRIIELATIINKGVVELQDIVTNKGLPSPSFAESAPYLIPDEASGAQDAVLDATAELQDLLLDPLNLLYRHGAVSHFSRFVHKISVPNR